MEMVVGLSFVWLGWSIIWAADIIAKAIREPRNYDVNFRNQEKKP